MSVPNLQSTLSQGKRRACVQGLVVESCNPTIGMAGWLMSLYQDSQESVVGCNAGRVMADGAGSTVKAEESTSEEWPHI